MELFFGVLGFIGSHLFLNGIVLNKMIFRRYLEEVTPVFHFDDDKGTIGISGEKPEEVVWAEVVKIKIVTTGKGPWEEDFWWLFYLNRRDEPVAIPQGAKGNEKLFDVLEKKFVDVDMKEIKRALGSTSDALFSVWPKGS